MMGPTHAPSPWICTEPRNEKEGYLIYAPMSKPPVPIAHCRSLRHIKILTAAPMMYDALEYIRDNGLTMTKEAIVFICEQAMSKAHGEVMP